VWVVIAPFNFPLALAGGPTAAALVTGNTVVLKGSSDTFWAGRLLADCIRDAGLPPGVFNYVSGSGGEVGEALIHHPDTAGVTFTGSFEVGMAIYRKLAAGPWPRPCILEMGGKNPCIVSAKGDLERAAQGIVRSAFGMGGQKCSALSRVYVEAPVADRLLELVVEKTRAIKVGDPRLRQNWLGPVIHAKAAGEFEGYCRQLRQAGARILAGGERLPLGPAYVAPTIAEAPPSHPLFKHEMFVPILMVARVKDFAQAMAEANDASLGLTAGCYGSPEEIEHFLEGIETGTLYLNRPQGATTGAWPGYQCFAGWKGSSSTGKAIGSAYYLPQYLREQSHTWVE
jgi:1-pyrroline-5-carboxylate dehydrogenase